MDWHDSLLSRHFLWVKALSTLYVIAVPLSHYALPHDMIWGIALFFLIAMLFTYPISALSQSRHVRLEIAVSLGLALIGIAGYLTSPWLIILAIASHGCWDVLKHKGVGSPFFGWYLTGCAIVDFSYTAALAAYLVFGG